MANFAKGGALPAMIRLSLATAVSALSACGMGQAPPVASATAQVGQGPAVWTLADDDTTIHLFGFTQVMRPGQKWRSEKLTALIADANLIVMENDPTDEQAQMEAQQLLPQIGLNRDGRSLSSMLSSDQADALKVVAADLGLPMQAIDSMRPWLASIQLGAVAIGRRNYDLQNNMPAQIAAIATASGKPILALERPADLMRLVSALPEETQLAMLNLTVRDIAENRDREDPVNAAWLAGDIAQIGQLLHGEDGAWSDRDVYEVMLVQRNQQWASTIKQLISEKKGTIFLAVGLGHLAGPDSLQSILSKAGFDVRRR